MTVITNVIFLSLVTTSLGWEPLPNIPSGRRSEYYVQHENGGYKYGYDTGDGIAAKQSANAANQVEGHYFYKASTGQNLDLKYTAGVQGFVPEGLEKLQNDIKGTNTYIPPQHKSNHYLPPSNNNLDSQGSNDDQANTGDSSYSFNIDTDTYKRQEISDASGNVQGSYSYSNDAGNHDLTYVAGSATGFLATSGSLSKPNGLLGKATYTDNSKQVWNSKDSSYSSKNSLKTDGSYSFGFSTGDQSRHESSDASGNVKGGYSYTNSVGNHDLSYIAGPNTGFQTTGGSLANPNGLNNLTPAGPVSNLVTSYSSPNINNDGSYSFSFSSPEQSRDEQSDHSGNVQGSYSYVNQAGTHDLSYMAGANIGFQATGGSLATPNGLTGNGFKKSSEITNLATPVTYSGPKSDGSYSFGFSTSDQSRNEQGDASGNVQGSYSYTNSAGAHDLSYTAGSATGFQITGGSLGVPLLQTTKLTDSPPVSQNTKSFPDGSFSFGYSLVDQSRNEQGDANGNIKGSYSYKNSAGTHDLSYIAGANTGFVATGGSLSVPNGLSTNTLSKDLRNSLTTHTYSEDSVSDHVNNGDASYNFTIDSDNYQRSESSDAVGNVLGSFSYKNNAGTHDLSYIAGSSTGFVATGGSLSIPPGLPNAQLHSPSTNTYLPPAAPSLPNLPSTKNAYSIGNLAVRTYLPPYNEKHKFGYIFDTKS